MEINKSVTPTKKTKSQAYVEALKNFLGNYELRAVHAFMEHQDFDASPVWIAKKLNISIEAVAQALDNLVILGLAERTSKGFQPKQIQFLIPENEMDPAVRMDRHTLVSLQILNRLDPNKHTLFRQGFVASNREAFLKFRADLDKLVDEFFLNSINEPKDGVYGFTATGVDILEEGVE